MAEARERLRIGRIRGVDVALLPVVAYVAAFALVPALLLFGAGWASGGGWTGFASVWNDPLNLAALENSFVQGGASAAVAVLLGLPAGVFLGRYQGRGRPWLLSLFLIPFLLPVLVMVQGLEVFVGPHGLVTAVWPSASALGTGLAGVVVVNVAFNVPLVVLLTAVGVALASEPLEESVATLGGGPWRRFRDVWGRSALLGAAAGGLATFLFSALAFASPLLVCGAKCYTVEVRIWSLDQQLASPAQASLLGLALVLVFAVPAVVYLMAVGRARGEPTARLGGRTPPFRSRHWTVGLGAWTLLLLAGELAFGAAVLVGSFWPPGVAGPTLAGWDALFGPHVTGQVGLSTWGAVANSVVFAGLCAAIATLLGISAGFWVRRSSRGSLALRLLLLFPLLLSPVLLAFALSTTWGAWLGTPGTVWGMIVVSQATLALPFVIPTLLVALLPLSPRPREAAELLGSRPLRAFVEVELPRARSGVLAAALLAFVIGVGEFTATFFLATPPFTTLSVEFYRLDALREPAAAGACAALLLLLSAAALLVISLGGRRVAV